MFDVNQAALAAFIKYNGSLTSATQTLFAELRSADSLNSIYMTGMQDAFKMERAASDFIQYLQSRNQISNLNISSFVPVPNINSNNNNQQHHSSPNNSVIQSDPRDFTEMSFSQRANFEYRGFGTDDEHKSIHYHSHSDLMWNATAIRIVDDDRRIPSLPPSECQEPPLMHQLSIVALNDDDTCTSATEDDDLHYNNGQNANSDRKTNEIETETGSEIEEKYENDDENKQKEGDDDEKWDGPLIEFKYDGLIMAPIEKIEFKWDITKVKGVKKKLKGLTDGALEFINNSEYEKLPFGDIQDHPDHPSQKKNHNKNHKNNNNTATKRKRKMKNNKGVSTKLKTGYGRSRARGAVKINDANPAPKDPPSPPPLLPPPCPPCPSPSLPIISCITNNANVDENDDVSIIPGNITFGDDTVNEPVAFKQYLRKQNVNKYDPKQHPFCKSNVFTEEGKHEEKQEDEDEEDYKDEDEGKELTETVVPQNTPSAVHNDNAIVGADKLPPLQPKMRKKRNKIDATENKDNYVINENVVRHHEAVNTVHEQQLDALNDIRADVQNLRNDIGAAHKKYSQRQSNEIEHLRDSLNHHFNVNQSNFDDLKEALNLLSNNNMIQRNDDDENSNCNENEVEYQINDEWKTKKKKKKEQE